MEESNNSNKKELLELIVKKRRLALEKQRDSNTKKYVDNEAISSDSNFNLNNNKNNNFKESSNNHNKGATEDKTWSLPGSNSNTGKKSKLSSNYYDYDLSKMKKSYGGYIVPERDQHLDSSLKNLKTEKRKLTVIRDISLIKDADGSNPKCKECGSVDIDVTFFDIFDLKICRGCKEKFPDKYSLLTKSEAKQDYLLTDGELNDREVFKVWIRPNPHKSTFSNMLLYIRESVEAFAINKWGSLEDLDKEFERREVSKKQRKEEKMLNSLKDLRKRTRTEEWRQKRNKTFNIPINHKHEFSDTENDDNSGSCEKKCKICGITVEVEEF
ncbi:hypothetical protein BB559_003912 [Furculomyces boomerangus]|uniref:XPA C-terminal domain-containing protein n=1 Tax=Furculomyces boomerangus TaxID=61424 RepID=A0A2T9YI17_9FUNG|nr:hypothetical protein BB559_003912 [Furculomyces boomerangus]